MSTHDAGTKLDQLYRRLTEPLAKKLASVPAVTPNRISLAAFAAGGLAAPLLVFARRPRTAGLAFLVSDLLDYVDGDVARAQGTMSARGDILDGILDRYTDFFCLSAICLAVVGRLREDQQQTAFICAPNQRVVSIVGLAAIIGSMMPSYVQALAVANGRRTVQSIGGRGTRNRVIFAGLIAGQPFWTLVTVALLSNIAAIHRSLYVLTKLTRSGTRRRESSAESHLFGSYRADCSLAKTRLGLTLS